MGTGPARPILRLRRRPLPRPGSGCPTAQLTIAGGPGRDYVEHPKVGVFALTRRIWRRERHRHAADRPSGSSWRRYLRSRRLLL